MPLPLSQRTPAVSGETKPFKLMEIDDIVGLTTVHDDVWLHLGPDLYGMSMPDARTTPLSLSFQLDSDDDFDADDDIGAHEALSEAIDEVATELAAARAENRSLHAAAAALEALDVHAAYLSSIMALTSLHGCVRAAPLLAGNAAEITASSILELAYAGGQPENKMYDAFVQISIAAYVRIDTDFRSRSLELLMQWKTEPSAAVRGEIQKRASNVIQVQDTGRNYLSLAFPEAVAHIWREAAPSGEAHAAARRKKQAQALDAVLLTPEQAQLIRVAWQEYRTAVEVLDREF